MPRLAPPPDTTTLDTQAKIDPFGAQGHTDFANRLVIGVEKLLLTSIGGSLSSVGGRLIFLNNPKLADYFGLQHLLVVGLNGIYSAVGNAVNPTLVKSRRRLRLRRM